MENDDILEADENMLARFGWQQEREAFLQYLENTHHIIQEIVRHHISSPNEQVYAVMKRSEWFFGTFNVCIPIAVGGRQQRLLLRCPLPHRFHTERAPDLAAEKLRTEAASFAWLSRYCSRVPIPMLRGFGLPNGLSFTPCKETASSHGMSDQSFLRKPSLPPSWRHFAPHHDLPTLQSGYLLMDFIEADRGETLSRKGPPRTAELQESFMRSLADIILDMSHPLHSIGAFHVDDSGAVSLSNRPLTASLAILENDGIPTIPRDDCYTNTIAYFTELLDCHDSRLQHQPNATRDEDDAAGQMAVVAMLRSLLPNFTQRNLRRGPFIFQLTDLNPSNIFVDTEYRITAICDLEWGCSLPLEMLQPPIWLSGYQLDDFLDEEPTKREECNDSFNAMCTTFTRLIDEIRNNKISPGTIDGRDMSSRIGNGSHLYFAALRNPHAAYNIFVNQLQPLFAPDQTTGKRCVEFQEIVAPYWCRDASDFIDGKIKQQESYVTLLRARCQQSKML